jgi:hypothetical protein
LRRNGAARDESDAEGCDPTTEHLRHCPLLGCDENCLYPSRI